MDAYHKEIAQLRTQLLEVTNSNTSLTGMLAISHMTRTNNMNAMLERCNALERRVASLERRREVTRQRAVRTGPLIADLRVRQEAHGEGSWAAPIILDMDDEERLR